MFWEYGSLFDFRGSRGRERVSKLCVSSQQILPAEFLRTSNNSDWFKCQTLLCTDILPTPCGVRVCACVCVYALVHQCVCVHVRMHVTMRARVCVCVCIRWCTHGRCLYALLYVLVEVAGGGVPTSHGPRGLDLPFQKMPVFLKFTHIHAHARTHTGTHTHTITHPHTASPACQRATWAVEACANRWEEPA